MFETVVAHLNDPYIYAPFLTVSFFKKVENVGF